MSCWCTMSYRGTFHQFQWPQHLWIIFLFLLSISFPLFALNLLSITLLSILIACLLSFFLKYTSSVIFPLIYLLLLFHQQKCLCVREPIVEDEHTDRPMLPVTSDDQNILSTSLGHAQTVRFLFWHGSFLLLLVHLVLSLFLDELSLIAADHCAMSAA